MEAFKQLQSSPGNLVSLDGLKSTLGRLFEPFQGSRQQDSHEFLMKLMEWLREDLAATAPDSDLNSLGVPDDSALHPDGTSEFERIFYGLHRATIRCGACSHMSTSFETFSAVSLSFPSEGAPSLERLITNHYADSPIEYRCTRCERLTLSTRTFCIWKMPSILHLNRFNNITGLRKIQRQVSFPLKGLDISKYGDHLHNRLDLYAVSKHYGTMQSGHYTAYCKVDNDRWISFDDQNTSEISESRVCSPAAYILFYKVK